MREGSMFEVVAREGGRKPPIQRGITLAASVTVHLAILGGILLLPRQPVRRARTEQQQRISFFDVPAFHLPSGQTGSAAGGGPAPVRETKRVEKRAQDETDLIPPARVPDYLPPPLPDAATLASGTGNGADTVDTNRIQRLAEAAKRRASETAAQVPVEVSALAELPKLANPRTVAEWFSELYPIELMARGVEGRAVISFVIEMDGHISSLEVVSTTHPDFGRATLRGARRMRFRPARLGGKPVRVKATMPIDWVLPRV
jgi:TonB family protein